MNKTEIEWCDCTWNPVTGCHHNCEYCYAKGIVRRFQGYYEPSCGENLKPSGTVPYTVIHPGNIKYKTKKGKLITAPYPHGFAPTFHPYRLGDPLKVKTPQTIFVVSMGDMFGKWVPDEWLGKIFAACEAAPQHRYLFLTKNPARYTELYEKGILPGGDNYWFGSTITTDEQKAWFSDEHNVFWSIEPIQSRFDCEITIEAHCDFVIIGAETSNRRGKIIPKREWVQDIVNACRAAGVPVFLKNNLSKVWGEALVQEFPWEEVKDNGI